MGVDAGFGNELTSEEIIERHQRLAGIIARERETADAPYDDIRQELFILLWQLHQRRIGHKDDLAGLASVAMRRKASEMVSRQTWTGYAKNGGRTAPVDPLRQKRESMDAIVEALGTDVFGAVDVLENVEMAYHHGQIMAALNRLTLPQRKYVLLRFWGGKTAKEISVEMDVRAQTLEAWWARDIKPVLRECLAHMAVQY